MNENTTVIAQFTIPAVHHWPDALDSRGYLAVEHRHLFYFKIGVEVKHDDREVEIHDLRELGEDVIFKKFKPSRYGGIMDFENSSCETLGKIILDYLQEKLGSERAMFCVVMEDDECGARVERNTHIARLLADHVAVRHSA